MPGDGVNGVDFQKIRLGIEDRRDEPLAPQTWRSDDQKSFALEHILSDVDRPSRVPRSGQHVKMTLNAIRHTLYLMCHRVWDPLAIPALRDRLQQSDLIHEISRHVFDKPRRGSWRDEAS